MVRWERAFRIISSHWPPINLFEEVSDPADLEAVFIVESMTNPRLREEAGDIQLVAPEDRITGNGCSCIMAAFTHPNPDGSRFSDGSYGVYYAARSEQTAIRETVHHRERLMRYQDVGQQEIFMRAYVGEIEAELADLRGMKQPLANLYCPDSYSASQRFGSERRANKDWGIAYNSVRDPDGECVAIFRPPACQPVRQGKHFIYYWDGSRIANVAEVSEVTL